MESMQKTQWGPGLLQQQQQQFQTTQPQNSYPIQDLNSHKFRSLLWNSGQILIANDF